MNYQETYAAVAKYFQGNNQELEKLANIDKQHVDSTFKVALVGGFSQGKTYFLNKLLDVDIFPTAVTPETALIYEVAYGEQPMMCTTCQGVTKSMPITNASLASLSASKNEFSSNDYVQAFLPHELLRQKLVIYDTPGIDDVLASRALLTLNVLNQCDAAIIVISAIAPFSLLERKFIETYLTGHAIQRLAILVNYCEKIPAHTLSKQLAFIKKRAEAICKTAELWKFSSDGLGDDYTALTLPAISERLRIWVQETPNAQRDTRDCLRLKTQLNQYLETIQSQLQMLQGDQQECLAKLDQALTALNNNNDQWRTLLNDFLDQGNDLASSLTLEVETLANELLNNTESIRENIHIRLVGLRDIVQCKIKTKLQHDLENFCQKIKECFGFSAALDAQNLPDCQFNLDIPLLQVKNSSSTSLQIFGIEGATILHSILSFLIKDAHLVTKVSQPILAVINGLFTQDHTPNAQEVQACLYKFTGTLNLAITQNIRNLYEESAKHFKCMQQMWYENQKQGIAELSTSTTLAERLKTLQAAYAKGQKLLQAI